MSAELGQQIVAGGIWLAVSFIIGGIIATSTNVVGSFKPNTGESRGPLDWLMWFLICTGAVFGAGELVYWVIRLGVAMKNGTLFMHDAG